MSQDASGNDQNCKLNEGNFRVLGLDLHNPVFFFSAFVILAFVFIALLFQTDAKAFFGWLRPELTSRFDWLLMISANIFVVFCLALIVSPWGGVRLGGAGARPAYSYTGWFAMLFAAGMGIGLMFFGVLEPVHHFQKPPLGIDANSVEVARNVGMAAAIFHWGLHPWAIYALVGLTLAYVHFNRGLPLTIRSAFHPLLGDKVWGWPGHIIDVLAVFATIFGLATSLGFGAGQIAAGLNYLFDTPDTNLTRVLLIAGITSIAVVSVVAGIEAGVKRLSEFNILLAIVLLVFVISVGPTLVIASGFFTNVIGYITYLPALSNWVGRDDVEFVHDWTTFYWAWWIAWSPFVGMFIARISYGRTIREFLTCVLIIPTLVSILWLSTFGGTAVAQVINDGYSGVTGTITHWRPELSLFKMLEPLPFGSVASLLAIALVTTFFITSSDSGSLVIDTITAGGNLNPPVAQRVFWAITEGLVAIALLLGGGLAALQAASISMGVPFALILLAMCVSLVVALLEDSATNLTKSVTVGETHSTKKLD